MLRATQAQVVHQANVDTVALRQLEIKYFVTFFSSFGTQALLIALICTGAISQVPGLGCDCSPIWVYTYWIAQTLCLSAALHIILCTIYISVYGQYLALKGPAGSMVNNCIPKCFHVVQRSDDGNYVGSSSRRNGS
jgi:hypothetical protein